MVIVTQLKESMTALFTAIRSHIDTKLGKTENAVSATRLKDPFTLTLEGDVHGSVSLRGDAPAIMVVRLPMASVAPGSYSKVSLDEKGRIVAAELLMAADIPALDASQVTTGTFRVTRIPGLDASKTVSGQFQEARIPNLPISHVTGLQTALDSKAAADSLPSRWYSEFSLLADTPVVFDIASIFGRPVDGASLVISLRVLDTDDTSPTYNKYINAEAVATVAVSDSEVVVFNHYTSTLMFTLALIA